MNQPISCQDICHIYKHPLSILIHLKFQDKDGCSRNGSREFLLEITDSNNPSFRLLDGFDKDFRGVVYSYHGGRSSFEGFDNFPRCMAHPILCWKSFCYRKNEHCYLDDKNLSTSNQIQELIWEEMVESEKHYYRRGPDSLQDDMLWSVLYGEVTSLSTINCPFTLTSLIVEQVAQFPFIKKIFFELSGFASDLDLRPFSKLVSLRLALNFHIDAEDIFSKNLIHLSNLRNLQVEALQEGYRFPIVLSFNKISTRLSLLFILGEWRTTLFPPNISLLTKLSDLSFYGFNLSSSFSNQKHI